MRETRTREVWTNVSHCRIVGASSFLYRERSGADPLPLLHRIPRDHAINLLPLSWVTESVYSFGLGDICVSEAMRLLNCEPGPIYGLNKSLKHVPSKDFEVNKNKKVWRSSHTLPQEILHIDHIISF